MDVRHNYEYGNNDGVSAYFEYHDGWSASRQIVEDPQANARFEIDFLKQVSEVNGVITSQWKALISVKPIRPD